jgi:hypothetical protein
LGLVADGGGFADDEGCTLLWVGALRVVVRHAWMRKRAGCTVACQGRHHQSVWQSQCAYAQGLK